MWVDELFFILNFSFYLSFRPIWIRLYFALLRSRLECGDFNKVFFVQPVGKFQKISHAIRPSWTCHLQHDGQCWDWFDSQIEKFKSQSTTTSKTVIKFFLLLCFYILFHIDLQSELWFCQKSAQSSSFPSKLSNEHHPNRSSG